MPMGGSDFSARVPLRVLDKSPCDKNSCDVDAIRDLSGDPAGMSALAHPVRLALLELLGRDGPLTATEAGERLGQSPGNMSWHLRVLARHGFVTEADGGVGRRRPWKLTTASVSVESVPPSGASRIAGDTLVSTVVERAFGQIRAWLSSRHTAPAEWRRASTVKVQSMYLTPAETVQLREEITALMDRFRDRDGEPAHRPEGAAMVSALLTLTPVSSPATPVSSPAIGASS